MEATCHVIVHSAARHLLERVSSHVQRVGIARPGVMGEQKSDGEAGRKLWGAPGASVARIEAASGLGHRPLDGAKRRVGDGGCCVVADLLRGGRNRLLGRLHRAENQLAGRFASQPRADRLASPGERFESVRQL